MPFFEYKCVECGHITAVLEKAGTKGPHPCAECGSEDTKKMFSTFAAVSSEQPACAQSSSCPSGTCPLARGG